MTKEEVLQKVNDYCTEKQYTSETLTDEFKEKFADFFAKKYPEASADDETAVNDLQFNLNTAFSATSKGITAKQRAFSVKESELLKQIEELKKQVDKVEKPKNVELPKEVQERLERLEQFELAQTEQEKRKKIIDSAKKNIREDLHKTFENYAKDFIVDLKEDVDVQSKKLTDRFQEIFKDSIGDIKPYSPTQRKEMDENIISNVKKVVIG